MKVINLVFFSNLIYKRFGQGMAKSASKTQSEVELKRQEILRLEQELILEKANLERERSQIEFEKSSIYESKLRDSSMILDPETISLVMQVKLTCSNS